MFKTLLVPLDHSPMAEQALVPAASIARSCNARVDIVLVHQQPVLANLRRSNRNDEQLQQAHRYTQDIANRLAKHGVTNCTHAVVTGKVEDAICARADAIAADLIVMTSHGETGFTRARLGSVAYSLVRKSALPVMVLRVADGIKPAIRPEPLFRRILVPLDGSPHSLYALGGAAQLARSTKGTIVLLRVVEPVPLFSQPIGLTTGALGSGVQPFLPTNIQDILATERQCSKVRNELTDVANRLAAKELVSVQVEVVVATHVASAIIDYASAAGIDLIAMSTHGRGASLFLLGSVADSILRASNIPLLLMKPVKTGVQSVARVPFSETQHALVG